jgi:hypothetical protein
MVKNMQKHILNIPILIVLMFSLSPAFGERGVDMLTQADSLYNKKKYAEARELYFNLYQQGYSTPATLLKMAFVHEGLGQTGQALFFLSTYYDQTEDGKAYDKIQTLANARNLVGYELSELDRIFIWINNRSDIFIIGLISGYFICLALILYSQKKNRVNRKMVAGFASLFLIAVLFLTINFISPPAKAIIARETYLMAGPSAGANLILLVNDGNRVSVSGEEDVWVRVDWKGKEGYIKKNDLLYYKSE